MPFGIVSEKITGWGGKTFLALYQARPAQIRKAISADCGSVHSSEACQEFPNGLFIELRGLVEPFAMAMPRQDHDFLQRASGMVVEGFCNPGWHAPVALDRHEEDRPITDLLHGFHEIEIRRTEMAAPGN